MTKPANDMRVRAAVWLDEYTAGDWTGAITDALISFVSDAVAQAVKERDEQLRIHIRWQDDEIHKQAEEIARLTSQVEYWKENADRRYQDAVDFKEEIARLVKERTAHGYRDALFTARTEVQELRAEIARLRAERESLSLQMDHHADECGCGVHKTLRAPKEAA